MDWMIRILGGVTEDDVARRMAAGLGELDCRRTYYEGRLRALEEAEEAHLAHLRCTATVAYNPPGDVLYSTFRFKDAVGSEPYTVRLFVAPRGAAGQGFVVSTHAETNLNEYDMPLTRIRAVSVHLSCLPEHRPTVAAMLRRHGLLRLERGSTELVTIRPLSDFDLNGTPIPWTPPSDGRKGWVIQVHLERSRYIMPLGGFDLRVAVYGERADQADNAE